MKMNTTKLIFLVHWKENLQSNVEENRETAVLKQGTSRNGFSMVRIEQREVSCT